MDKEKPEFGWEITIDFLGAPNNQLQLACTDEHDYYYKWCVLAEIVCGVIRDEKQVEEAFLKGIFRIIRPKNGNKPQGIQYLNPAAIEKVTIIEIDKNYRLQREGRLKDDSRS